MKDKFMRKAINLSRNLKNTISRKLGEANNVEKEQMKNEIRNIINDGTNDYISELRNLFPHTRINYKHLNDILDELQSLQQSNEERSQELKNLIKGSLEAAINENDGNDENNYLPYAIGSVTILLSIGMILFFKRRH